MNLNESSTTNITKEFRKSIDQLVTGDETGNLSSFPPLSLSLSLFLSFPLCFFLSLFSLHFFYRFVMKKKETNKQN